MTGSKVKTNVKRWHLKEGITALLNSLPEDIIDSKFYMDSGEEQKT